MCSRWSKLQIRLGLGLRVKVRDRVMVIVWYWLELGLVDRKVPCHTFVHSLTFGL